MTADRTKKTPAKKTATKKAPARKTAAKKASAPRAESRPRKSAAHVARAASDELAQLVGKRVEGVTGVDRSDDDGWTIRIEVLELRRIPETTDVLGLYEVEADDQGALMSYRRLARYTRAESREGD